MLGSILLFVVIIFLLLVLYKPEVSRQQFLLSSERTADVTWKQEAVLNDEIFYIDFDINDAQGDITTDEKGISEIVNTSEISDPTDVSDIVSNETDIVGIESFKNQCSTCDIRQHPDFHQYVLKSSISAYRNVQPSAKMMSKKRSVPAANANANRSSVSGAGSSPPPAPIHPPYQKNIPSLFQVNDPNDMQTYNRIMQANLKDPRIRAAIEKQFYQAKQIEHNLLDNIGKL